MERKRIIIFVLIICIVIGVASCLVKRSYILKFPCRCVPHTEWSIRMDTPDKLCVTSVKNTKKVVEQVNTFHFNRPDYIQFSLAKEISVGSIVHPGQVIAEISSNEDKLKYQMVLTEHAKVMALLQSLRAGAKTAVQQEAVQAVNYAKAQMETSKAQLDRRRKLYEKKLISSEELELAETTYNLSKINLQLQQAGVNNVTTGEKPELIEASLQELNGLEEQLLILKEKSESCYITSPVCGVVSDCIEEGVICRVNKIDTLVVQIPVLETHIPHIKIGQRVCLILPNSSNNYVQCHISKIGPQVQLINNQMMYFVYALLANTDQSVWPMSSGLAKIECQHTSLLNILINRWNIFKYYKMSF